MSKKRKRTKKQSKLLPVPKDGDTIELAGQKFLYKESAQLPAVLNASIASGGGFKLPDPTKFEDFAEAYANTTWLYSCVFAIGNSLAKMPLKLWLESGDDEKATRTEVKTHPILKLFRKQNDQKDTIEDLIEKVMISLELGGDGYIEIVSGKIGDNDIPTELYHVDPAKMEIVCTRDGKGIDHYLYTTTVHGQKIEKKFKPEEIIHVHYHNPNDDWYGQGGALAAARPILLEQYTERYCQRFFENNATPQGVLMTDQPVDKANAERVLREWRSKYGGVDKSGKIGLLPLGLKYEKIGSFLNELELEELSNNSREKIMAAMGVNEAVLGINSRMPRDVARTMMNHFYTMTLEPKARKVANGLTFSLLSLFPNTEGMYLEFDFSQVTAAPYDIRLKRWTELFGLGACTPNDISVDMTGKVSEEQWADKRFLDKRYLPLELVDELIGADSEEQEHRNTSDEIKALKERVEEIESKEEV